MDMGGEASRRGTSSKWKSCFHILGEHHGFQNGVHGRDLNEEPATDLNMLGVSLVLRANDFHFT